MGTVNGLESGDFGPDINTQRLILPAGRQWEKDMGGGGFTKEMCSKGERGPFCPDQTKQTRRRGRRESRGSAGSPPGL